MLEIQGAYTNNEHSAVLKVLAQFDNGVLHIWHQSEPFYLLTSCSDFSISASDADSTGMIKLNAGGWIETADLENLKLLNEELEKIDQRNPHKSFGAHVFILMIALLFLFFSAWFLSRNGG